MTYRLSVSAGTKLGLVRRAAAEWDAMQLAKGFGYHAVDRAAVLGALENLMLPLLEPSGGEKLTVLLEGGISGKWTKEQTVSLRGLHCRIDLAYAR